MKPYILLLLIALTGTVVCATPYGNLQIEMTKTWRIQSNPGPINFTGMLTVNDSEQHIKSINVTPPLQVKAQGDEVFVYYSGQSNGTLDFSATVLMDIDYNPVIVKDEPLSGRSFNGTNITMPDNDIQAIANNLSIKNSSLKTLVQLANWVNTNMVYDTKYFGETNNASIVLDRQRGVCMDYTHLFLAMANALGFQSRYASGYALSNGWEPHAWAEVYIGNQWVAFDPTFEQGGDIDSSHVMIAYGNDASDIYDQVVAYGDAVIKTNTSLKVLGANKSEYVDISILVNNIDEPATVLVNNQLNRYIIGTYSIALPSEYGGSDRRVIIIGPKENFQQQIFFNSTHFNQNYQYQIPVMVSYNDVVKNESVHITTATPTPKPTQNNSCLPAAILVLVLVGYVRATE